MNACPQCNYLLDAFDRICPRCQGKGVKATTPTPATPTKMQRMKQEALQTQSTSETVGGSLRGGLLALIPAFIITWIFTMHMVVNLPARDHQASVLSAEFMFGALFMVPLCTLCGAGVGAWIGSSFPIQQTREWAIRGAIAAVVICAIETFLISCHLDDGFIIVYPAIFISVVLSGAYGTVERQRNGYDGNDGYYFSLAGLGLLCALFPMLGVILIIVLNRNGSDKAPAALWGTVIGGGFVALSLLGNLLKAH